ncbi:hypothetical protein ACS0TY_014115 [Phlomoides rotata]
MVTLMVDKLNEMLRQVVVNAMASHLTPPVTPTTTMPTLNTRVDPPVQGSGHVPVQNMSSPPVAPTVEKSNREDEERVGRSSRVIGVDESSSGEEESEMRTNVHLEIDALRREMEEMKKMYKNMTNPMFKPVGSPFSEEILMDPFLEISRH